MGVDMTELSHMQSYSSETAEPRAMWPAQNIDPEVFNKTANVFENLNSRAAQMLEFLLNEEFKTARSSNRVHLKLTFWVIRNKILAKAKRIFDLLFSLLSLILLSPLFLIAAIAIKLDSPGPIIYKQVRVGKGGKRFYCYKFRSMVINADAMKKDLLAQNEADGLVFKMRKDPRITRVGRIIRKLSVDEIPQLFNVIKGEMSIVGPRPPVPVEVENYNYTQFHRLDAVPGITGLQQIKGRSDITFKRWVELDLQYIEDQSLWKDIEIVLLTIPAVISGKGAY